MKKMPHLNTNNMPKSTNGEISLLTRYGLVSTLRLIKDLMSNMVSATHEGEC